VKALIMPVTSSTSTHLTPSAEPMTLASSPGEAHAAAIFDDGGPAPKAAGPLVAPAPLVAPKSRAELRRLFLEQSAITLGQSWADQWRDDLRREGRPAAGGWPGTLREARVRVEHHLLAEVTRRKMSAVTEAEREVAARKAYASARAQWCRQAEPEAP
jgi:hypothetical protein